MREMAHERMPRTSAFRPHAGLQSSSGRPQSVCWAMSHSREISGSATKSAIHLQTSQSVHGVRAQRFNYSISWPAMLIKNSLCKSRAMCVNEDGQSSIEPCESSTLMKEADSTVSTWCLQHQNCISIWCTWSTHKWRHLHRPPICRQGQPTWECKAGTTPSSML